MFLNSQSINQACTQQRETREVILKNLTQSGFSPPTPTGTQSTFILLRKPGQTPQWNAEITDESPGAQHPSSAKPGGLPALEGLLSPAGQRSWEGNGLILTPHQFVTKLAWGPFLPFILQVVARMLSQDLCLFLGISHCPHTQPTQNGQCSLPRRLPLLRTRTLQGWIQ